MRTTELERTIRDEASVKDGRSRYTTLLDFYQEDPRYYAIGKFTDLVSSNPFWDTIIEASERNYNGTKDAGQVVEFLSIRDKGPAEAQLFLSADAQHNGVDAWYEVKNIRWDDEAETLYLVSGEVLSTG